MLKNLGIILLCMTLVFTTSGNSRGLIFKNLAKTMHSMKIDSNAPIPAAEEIFEQIDEKKVSITILVNPLIRASEYKQIRNRPSNDWMLFNSFTKILLPPPKK